MSTLDLKRSGILLLVCLMTSLSSYAQLHGTVINKKGKAVKHLKICLRKITDSTQSDNQGHFYFPNVSPDDTIVITVSKREDAVIPVGYVKNLVVVLQKKNFIVKKDTENVVCEYKRSRLSLQNTNIITREQIEDISATSIYDIFSFDIPGVDVIDDSEGSRIIIRGATSLEQGREPLLVIDGMYFESSAAADVRVSVNDIEKIEILKEGAGYGVKGGYGVIVITTRK